MLASSRYPGAALYEHGNCGYPYRGSRRRFRPRILGVSHITGNRNLPSALGEAQYSARSGSGASFTFAVNRNGTIVQCFDPFAFAPWTNGDTNNPDMTSPLIAAAVRSPYNMNEHVLVTIENVGFESSLGSPAPITDAQVEANAQIYAWAARHEGITKIDIDVVVGHRMINSVTRWNCPTRGDLAALRRRIVNRANAILTPAAPSVPNPIEDLDMIVRPGTLILRTGRVALPANRTFNAFQYAGPDAAGAPKLIRYNGLNIGGSAEVIGLAHWEAGKTEEDCYLVSLFAYLPGFGEKQFVYWSKSPLPAPDVTWDAIQVPSDPQALVDAHNRGKTEGADAVLEAAKAAAKPLGAL